MTSTSASTMPRTFSRCASCHFEFPSPRTRAYCGIECERDAASHPTAIDDARMSLDVALESALPWERAVAAHVARKAMSDPMAVLRFLRVQRERFDPRVLTALRTLATAVCSLKRPMPTCGGMDA